MLKFSKIPTIPRLKCPECLSDKITHYLGAQVGKYQCKACGYIGPLVLQEDIKSKSKDKLTILKK